MLTIDLRGDKAVLRFMTSPSALSVIFPTSSLEAISVTQGPAGILHEVICEDALRHTSFDIFKTRMELRNCPNIPFADSLCKSTRRCGSVYLGVDVLRVRELFKKMCIRDT